MTKRSNEEIAKAALAPFNLADFVDGLGQPRKQPEVVLAGPSVLKKDSARSEQLAKRVRAKPNQCFSNCWRAVERLARYAEAAYVEGFVVFPAKLLRTALEHAWLECEGVILDPTLPQAEAVYFPGLRFLGRDRLIEAAALPGLIECGHSLPIFHRFGFGGCLHPDFQAAAAGAQRFAFGLLPSSAAALPAPQTTEP
jgi:hypothetical protein